MTRRKFLDQVALGMVAASTAADALSSDSTQNKNDVPLIVSTWPFGKASNEAGLKVLSQGGSILDASIRNRLEQLRRHVARG